MPPNLSRKRRAIKLSIICSLGLILLLGLATWVGGKVRGVEFAPTHFTQRDFHYWEIPVVHLQVTPIRRSTRSTQTTTYLRSLNALDVPKDPAKEYDLVEVQQGYFGEVTKGDAEILVAYLALHDGSQVIWEQWSRDHQPAAKVLWPIVQRLAQRELYLLVPEVFAIAQQETDPVKLSEALDDHLRTAYLQLAEDLVAAEQPEMAVELLREAQQDFPNNEAYETLLSQLDEPADA